MSHHPSVKDAKFVRPAHTINVLHEARCGYVSVNVGMKHTRIFRKVGLASMVIAKLLVVKRIGPL